MKLIKGNRYWFVPIPLVGVLVDITDIRIYFKYFIKITAQTIHKHDGPQFTTWRWMSVSEDEWIPYYE